jgi:hypothetical protein
MTVTRPLSNLALAMMALPAILGAPLLYLRPEGAWAWAVAMFLLPVVWFGLRTAGKAFGNTSVRARMMLPERAGDARKAMSGAMIFASLMLAVPLGARLAGALGLIEDAWAHEIADRAANVFIGGYLVFHGNRLPKILLPSVWCDAAIMQTLRRRTGWAYVLSGFALAAVWLILPVHLAQLVGMAVVAVGVLLPSVVMMLFYATRRPQPQNR